MNRLVIGLVAGVVASFAAAGAPAQEPGDVMQARRKMPLAVDGQVVARLPIGARVKIERIESDRAWCRTSNGPGWLELKDLMTCQEALEFWKKKIDAGDATAIYHLGSAQEALGNLRQAIGTFDQFLKIYPNSTAGLTLRGVCWTKLGDPERAKRDYTAAIEISPSAMIYSDRAVAWNDLGDGKAALQDCVMALLLDSRCTLARVNRGEAHQLLGQYEEAVTDFEETISIDPASYSAYRSYALLRGAAADDKFRNGKQAVELAQKACEATNYKDALSLSSLAVAYGETGDWDSAIKWQNAAIEQEKLRKNDGEHQLRLEAFKAHQPYRLVVGIPVPSD